MASESETQKLNVSKVGCGGNTPLHEAVQRVQCTNFYQVQQLDEKHIQYIKLLLKFNPYVNVQNSEGYTPLHLAIRNQRLLSVLEALTKDSEYVFIDVDSANVEGDAAIHQILNYRSDEDAIKVLAFLMKLKADINKKNSKDETILHLALAKNSSDLLIKTIIDHGANLNTTDKKNYDGYTPLHLAMKKQRSLDVLEALTKDAEHVLIDVDSVNVEGNAAIHEILNYSKTNNAVKVLALLLKLKPDINKRNSKDESILYMAIAQNSSDLLIKAIIDNGADLSTADEQGRTALYHTVSPVTSTYNEHTAQLNSRFRNVGIVKSLVEKGSKIDTVAKNGYSPLLLAVVLKKTDYVKAMLENGPDLREGGLEQTATTFCLEVEDFSMRQRIVSYPSSEYYNMTPLLISVYDCNKEMAEMLIKAGASVIAVNSSGENALHVLTKCTQSVNNKAQHEQIAKLLIENGIDLNANDNSGGMALNYAIKNNKHDIVVYILERGLDKL